MVLINEWLPNPSGADSAAEWVELFNNGGEKIFLRDWTLVSGTGKKFIFKDQSVSAGGYLVLNKPETKLVLRNQNESLSLYDSQGKLVSQSAFSGSAQDGKSLARQSLGDGGFSQNSFVFAEPTPGTVNIIVKEISVTENYPVDKLLGQSIGLFDILGLALFVGLIYSFFIIVTFKNNDYLSKLFFDRD
mgnify:CR=1 FL=1